MALILRRPFTLRTALTMAITLVAVLVWPATMVLAARSQDADFDGYTNGDGLSALSIDGVTFSTAQSSRWRIVDVMPGFSRLANRALGDVNGGGVDDLTVTFDSPQSRIEFDFATRGGTSITVQGFLNGELVTSNVYNGTSVTDSDAEGTALIEAPVDTLIISSDANRAVIDNLSLTSPAPANGAFNPGDERINPQDYAPVAIYCRDNGVDIYWINTDGSGMPFVFASNALIATVPAAPAEDTEITASGAVSLYRLVSGEFYVSAGPDAEGKTYAFLWNGCPPAYSQTYIRDANTGEETLTETREY